MKTEIFERLKSEAYQISDWESIDSDTLLERVVELAVKECASICLARHDTWRWDEEADSDSGPRDCARSIEKHFGVTE